MTIHFLLINCSYCPLVRREEYYDLSVVADFFFFFFFFFLTK